MSTAGVEGFPTCQGEMLTPVLTWIKVLVPLTAANGEAPPARPWVARKYKTGGQLVQAPNARALRA